jgi:hypothetical protein
MLLVPLYITFLFPWKYTLLFFLLLLASLLFIVITSEGKIRLIKIEVPMFFTALLIFIYFVRIFFLSGVGFIDLKYFVLIWLFYSLFLVGANSNFDRFHQALKNISLIFIFASFLQFFNLYPVIFDLIYTKDDFFTDYKILGRVPGISYVSGYNAFFSAIFAIYFLNYFFTQKKIIFLYLLLFWALSFVVIVSQSRLVFISFLLTLSLISLVNIFKFKKILLLYSPFLVGIPFIFQFNFYQYFPYLSKIFLNQQSNYGAILIREEKLDRVAPFLDLFSLESLLGYGRSAITQNTMSFDNSYLSYIVIFGFIFTFVYFLLILIVFYSSYFLNNKFFTLTTTSILFFIFPIGFFSDYLIDIRFNLFFYLFLGLVFFGSQRYGKS